MYFFKVKEENLVEDNDNKLNLDIKVESSQPDKLDWCIQNTKLFHAEPTGSVKLCYESALYDDETCDESTFLVQRNARNISVFTPIREAPQPNRYQCDTCLVYFKNKSKLKMHIQTKHWDTRLDKTLPKSKSLHKCSICCKIFKYNYWHTHMKEVHGLNRYECTKCDTILKNKTNFKRHKANVHGKRHEYSRKCDIELKCDLCPKEFTNKTALNHHITNCHSRSVECSICGSKLKSEAYLRAHIRRVHYDDGKKHSCNICGKKFKSPRYVRVHKKNSHGMVINIKCDVCGRQFKKESRLRDHGICNRKNTIK